MKKIVRFYYFKSEQQEGYQFEILVEGKYEFMSFYPLVKRENAKKDEEANFVHFSIINKLEELKQQGYIVYFV